MVSYTSTPATTAEEALAHTKVMKPTHVTHASRIRFLEELLVHQLPP